MSNSNQRSSSQLKEASVRSHSRTDQRRSAAQHDSTEEITRHLKQMTEGKSSTTIKPSGMAGNSRQKSSSRPDIVGSEDPNSIRNGSKKSFKSRSRHMRAQSSNHGTHQKLDTESSNNFHKHISYTN